MNEKALRLKYIRALEKFVSRNIALLKKENFELEKYLISFEKFKEQFEKTTPIRLNSSYLKKLSEYKELLIKTYLNHSKDFITERAMLLKEANLLAKEKNKTSYKRAKYKN